MTVQRIREAGHRPPEKEQRPVLVFALLIEITQPAVSSGRDLSPSTACEAPKNPCETLAREL